MAGRRYCLGAYLYTFALTVLLMVVIPPSCDAFIWKYHPTMTSVSLRSRLSAAPGKGVANDVSLIFAKPAAARTVAVRRPAFLWARKVDAEDEAADVGAGDDDIFGKSVDEDEGSHLTPWSDKFNMFTVDDDIFGDVKVSSPDSESELEKLVRENWKQFSDNEIPQNVIRTDGVTEVSADQSSDSEDDDDDGEIDSPEVDWVRLLENAGEPGVDSVGSENDAKAFEALLKGDCPKNSNVYVLFYQIKGKHYGDKKFATAVENHEIFAKGFKRVLFSEVFDLGSDIGNGVVTIFGGLEGQNDVTQSDIREFTQNDPLMTGGFVEDSEVMDFDQIGKNLGSE
jgi:hypothetical protein